MAAPADSPIAEDSPDSDAATNPFASPPEEASNSFLDNAPAPVLAPHPRASGEYCACFKVMALHDHPHRRSDFFSRDVSLHSIEKVATGTCSQEKMCGDPRAL